MGTNGKAPAAGSLLPPAGVQADTPTDSWTNLGVLKATSIMFFRGFWGGCREAVCRVLRYKKRKRIHTPAGHGGAGK
jgi:hypothetical protein